MQQETSTNTYDIYSLISVVDCYESDEEDNLESPRLENDPVRIAKVKALLRKEACTWPEIQLAPHKVLLRLIIDGPVCSLVKMDDLETHLNVRRILNGSLEEYTLFPTEDQNHMLFGAIIWQILI